MFIEFKKSTIINISCIKKILKKSNKEFKQTIIMITHNMEIAKYADRIIKIEDGKIVKEV